MKVSLLVATMVALILPAPLSDTVAHADVGAGVRRCFEVAGSPGDAAVVNLTPVLAQGQGYGVLVSSDSDAAPNASNVNYGSGSVDPNVAIAPIGADGRVCFENGPLAGVDLVADHLGTIDAAVYRSATASGAPRRLIDTRQSAGRVGPGVRRCFEVAGSPGDAAVVNLTPVLAQGQGYGVLVSSDSDAAPNASNVNYGSGSVDPNVAIAPIGADGRVCFENGPLAGVDLVADHLGTIDAAVYRSATASGAPRRLIDTRQSAGRVGPGVRRCFEVAGSPGDAAVVNLTPVLAQGQGYGVLVSSDSDAAPNASNVNYGSGSVDPNVAIAPIGADGRVCFENGPLAGVDLVADHLGTIDAAVYRSATASGAPRRLIDTRQSAGRVGPTVGIGTWLDVASGSGRQPTVVIDSGVYPDSSGVQFLISGEVDDRCSCRPGGFDATGPQEDSKYHIYPDVDLSAGDVIEARWTDRSGAARSSTWTVGSVTPSATSSTSATPSPSATRAPSPSPSSANVTHGSQLSAENTGVRGAGYVYDRATDTFSHPVHGPLRPSGTIRTSFDGQVIENVDVTGAILVEHDNVTVRNCRVRYSESDKGINARSASPRGTLIEFCDVTNVGSVPHEAEGLLLSHGTARFLNIYGWRVGFIVGAETRLEYNRITDARSISGTHGTGGSADGGANIVFYRNYIEGSTSAALALYSRSAFNGVLVEDNYFDASTTPSFCLNAGNNKNGVGVNKNIRVRGNVFGTTKYPECGQFGPYYNWDPSRPGAQWCNNRWTDGRAVGKETGC